MNKWGIDSQDADCMEVAVVAHDLRNHLAVIGTAARLVRWQLRNKDTAESDLIPPLLTSLVGAVRDSTVLLDDLLVATGAMRYETAGERVAPVDLVALARRLVVLERSANDTHTFHVFARTPALIGTWSEARVARIVRNLLSNAVKYSPDGSDVVIEIERDGADAVLRINDDGIGVASSERSAIYAPFQRGAVAQRVAEGNGLGLTSAAQLVASLGGVITHEPRPEGGTTFEVRLPLA